MNVPRVHATRWHREMSVGRTRPQLFACQDPDGRSHDYVVKSHKKLGIYILCEHVAAVLGRLLQMPVPQNVIVDVDVRLVNEIPDQSVRDLFLDIPGPHFGSYAKTGGYRIVARDEHITPDMMPQALDIFAFDMLIQNTDRAHRAEYGKPNLLVNGKRFVILDHELAFSFLSLVGPAPEPWLLRNESFARNHFFYRWIRGCKDLDSTCFDGFLDRFTALDSATFDAIADTIPPEWRNPANAGKIIAHLNKVHQNADRFKRGLLEAIT